MDLSLLIAVIVVGVLGLVFGLILAIASKLFAVKKDPTVELVINALPGANCGACGYSGCEAYAEAVAAGECDINLCTVGGEACRKELEAITGRTAGEGTRMVARVLCGGTLGNRKKEYDYSGLETCLDANLLYGGDNACTYGCLGMGDCQKACPFDAIAMIEGVAFILEDKCKSCEICVGVCPKNIIEMVPEDAAVTITCSNHDKGGVAMKGCKVACIACGKCVKECPVDAIAIDNFLAKIDYEKCINCGKCIQVCPTNAIIRYNKKKKKIVKKPKTIEEA
ncbi:MAG TPA: RnfABCDGE type electron transport complex subunit B [Clostridia bacterium]|nr:RnfABCDGE type electron transport complex subunit B [Clostridia bacterium]HPQ47904.1 RnfABCDGE type electron transport complex subunit B [Clostridia bacterium]HRX41682.1 RnfABCDGE type electron transport complex subunit B [Clostridia bacterium]